MIECETFCDDNRVDDVDVVYIYSCLFYKQNFSNWTELQNNIKQRPSLFQRTGAIIIVTPKWQKCHLIYCPFSLFFPFFLKDIRKDDNIVTQRVILCDSSSEGHSQKVLPFIAILILVTLCLFASFTNLSICPFALAMCIVGYIKS